jgi:hypothetical protein
MSTKRHCDTCDKAVPEPEAKGWWHAGQGSGDRDFCSVGCLAKFVQAEMTRPRPVTLADIVESGDDRV